MTSDPIVERLFALEQFGIKLGLQNIDALLTALGRPEQAFTTAHIAGTNGKGSVSAMIERALRHGGARTGRYTSPHLDRIEERVAVDGEAVPAGEFRDAARDVLSVVDNLQRTGALETTPTFFEVTTAIALEVFRRRAVDVGVVEVGLGGRFDATNVITPRVCAITSIAFDHERHLGDSLSQIAYEKAGILKRDVPAVVGEVPPEAAAVIARVAAEVGAPLAPAGTDLVTARTLGHGRATVTIETPVRRYANVRLALAGAHQINNAVVAVRTLELLDALGTRVASNAIVAGLEQAVWPARLEWLRPREGAPLLIDAAHNPAGAQALADYLLAADVAPLPIVLAVMRDKNVDAMIRALAPVASRFIATAVRSPRALAADALAAAMRRIAPAVPAQAIAHPDAAVADAIAADRAAAAAGSIFFVGPLRARLVASGAVSFAC